MSGRCTGWVLRHGPRPSDVGQDGKPYGLARARALRAVLYTIADAANADGEHAHPGLAAMEDGSLYSRRQVQKLAADLVTEGWVAIEEEGGGRGKARVYAVNMELRKGAATASFEERVQDGIENGADSQLKGAGSGPIGAVTVPESGPNGLPTVTTTEPPTLPARNAGAMTEIDDLCNQLADAIGNHNAPRPKVSARWRRDMRLLLERGPLKIDEPEPQTATKISQSIGFLFTHLADPSGRDGFCWADQIRSPGALRDHWVQLRLAARRLAGASVGQGGQAVERAAARLAGDAPAAPQQRPRLGLLPGAASPKEEAG